MNAGCDLDTKNDITMFTPRAQVHHVGESYFFPDTTVLNPKRHFLKIIVKMVVRVWLLVTWARLGLVNSKMIKILYPQAPVLCEVLWPTKYVTSFGVLSFK